MRNQSKLLAALVAAFLLMAFCGCSEKGDESEENPAPDAKSSPQASSEEMPTQLEDNGKAPVAAANTSLSDVVTSWDTGRKDEATRLFLSIDWRDASVFREIAGLTMSEEQLVALAENERKRIAEETMTLLGSMRKLFFHVASEAERLAGSGNATEAEEYLEAVRRYGDTLSGADHLEMVKMHGKAATAYAEKKLSELK